MYINGVWKKDGLPSPKSHVHPGTALPGGYYGNQANGQVDEVRIWSVARTQQQLVANKDGELTGTQTGLVGYWPMNEGTGAVLHDVSGWGRDIDLTNAGYGSASWTNGRYSINTNTGSYRYGFNGQEHSTEIGEDDYTAMFWEYDSRIGRRWNVDPKPVASFSVYAAFANNPIANFDHMGDTPRIARGQNGAPTGQVGQRFKFVNDGTVGNGKDNDPQMAGLATTFLNNLNQQINGQTVGTGTGARTISLNTNDPLASLITVTFGSSGVSESSMTENSIFINVNEMKKNANTATHEWLHTAGLMDRYIEIYGYKPSSKGIAINQQRSGAIFMENLPFGYDSEYKWNQNMMSVAGGQITTQQWSIVFSGISERSLGGLGVVSILMSNGHISPSPGSKYFEQVKNSMKGLTFSGNQAFLASTGTTSLNRPFVEGANPAPLHFIIHTLNGNIYPNTGPTQNLMQFPPNKSAIDNFRR